MPAVRNIAPARISSAHPTELTVIIPAAGCGKKMKSFGSRSLIEVTQGITLMHYQVEMIRTVFPAADIIMITGFDAARVHRHVPEGVRVIENENYENTNVAKSISIGLRASISSNIMIVYGDILFNAEALSIANKGTAALIDTMGLIDEREVGMTPGEEYVLHFSYGLPAKWGKVVFLSGHELHHFSKFVHDKANSKAFTFEALNHVIDRGGRIQAIEPPGAKIAEIDFVQDISPALRYFA